MLAPTAAGDASTSGAHYPQNLNNDIALMKKYKNKAPGDNYAKI